MNAIPKSILPIDIGGESGKTIRELHGLYISSTACKLYIRNVIKQNIHVYRIF